MAQRHEHWVTEAIALAIENVRLGRGGPFGAVVIKEDQIVASGTNLVTAMNDPTAHAEIMAIRAACRALNTFELRDCEIYSSCEPCPMCLGAIYWARASAYYFACTRADAAEAGFDDAFIYHQLNLSAEQRQIRSQLIAPRNALEPFVEWRRSANKIVY
ncbi:MAG: nucleoside deaminase [Acidobacteriaceae bacterium]|nr:nucleoside deaminase [Acidobacteriaceae bacterium]MBV9781779.1 nucleoside deaminase [Acidobacteriaceae bacterium]